MELIDKKALIDDVMNNPIEIPILEGNTVVGVRRIRGEYLEERINEQPIINAVPVVYCIDCIHRVYDEDYDVYRCSQTGWYDGDYFFCADGEKKEGDVR